MAFLRCLARRGALLLSLLLSLSLPVSPALAAGEKIRIGWTSWADAEAISMIAERILRDELGYDVEMVFDNIGNIFQAMADGEVDVMLMAWLPVHEDYLDKHDRVFEDLGVAYGGGLIGWVVPSYVPEDVFNSFEDLPKPEVKRQLRGRIAGLGESAGMMEQLRTAMDEYGLDGYTIVYGNEVSAIASIRRAVAEQRWVLAGSWRPHWMFAEWDLRFIEDPKKIFGETQTIHSMGRPGFSADFPKLANFFAGFEIPLDELQAVMLRGTKVILDQAVSEYIESHPERVAAWVANAR